MPKVDDLGVGDLYSHVAAITQVATQFDKGRLVRRGRTPSSRLSTRHDVTEQQGNNVRLERRKRVHVVYQSPSDGCYSSLHRSARGAPPGGSQTAAGGRVASTRRAHGREMQSHQSNRWVQLRAMASSTAEQNAPRVKTFEPEQLRRYVCVHV